MKTLLLTTTFMLLTFGSVLAQDTLTNVQAKPARSLRYANTFTLGSKLVQPIVFGGFNINGVYYAGNRLTLEYSHGGFLTYPEYTKSPEQTAQKANIKIPWTTGFGVGYRLTPTLDARMEFKAHRFNVDFEGTNASVNYTTFTVGPGLYYRQFLGRTTGFNVELSTRYWYDVASSLQNNEFAYTGSNGERQVHEAVKMGLSFNVGVGYTFGRNRTR